MSVSSDLIILESKNRSSGSINSFKISLPEITTNGTYLFTSFSMTNNLYNVVSGENNKIYINHSVDGDQVLTLTPGNYTENDLIVEIKTQLDSISAVVYTVTYSDTTGKLTISPDSGNIYFTFGTNTTDSARVLMGFNESDGIAAASQISDNPIDIKLHDYIVLKIIQDGYQYVTLNGGTEASVIIPIDGNIAFGGAIHYTNNLNYAQYFKFSSALTSLDIELYASDGDMLDTNGTEFAFSMKRIF